MSNRIIIEAQELISCVKCNHEFPLSEGITHQTIDRYQEEFDDELKHERKLLQSQLEKDAERKATRTYESRLKEIGEQLSEKNTALEKMQNQMEETKVRAAKEASAEAESRAASLAEEIEAKDNKLKEYQAQELELRKEKKQLEEARQEQEIQLHRRVDEEKKRISQEANEVHKLREAEFKKKIDDAQKANEELRRKLERGSQQLQGEVLELEVENLLESAFAFDQIDEVKKGVRGADVIQTVMTRTGTPCGTIIWETKRAENWSNNWIPKLKADQQEASAEVAVLVSAAFPRETTDPFFIEDGIWLVRPYAVRALAEALRSVLIESARQKVVSAGKNEKAEAIYDYLCSTAFAQKIRGVIETNEMMKQELDKEKAAFARIWKKREAQNEKIMTNMLGMCGELQGIADTGLPELESLGNLLETS
jgi:hypothetical protein